VSGIARENARTAVWNAGVPPRLGDNRSSPWSIRAQSARREQGASPRIDPQTTLIVRQAVARRDAATAIWGFADFCGRTGGVPGSSPEAGDDTLFALEDSVGAGHVRVGIGANTPVTGQADRALPTCLVEQHPGGGPPATIAKRREMSGETARPGGQCQSPAAPAAQAWSEGF
jgi:hypothetical protein